MEFSARKSTRLKGYDYSVSGAYFITICTVDKACLLGQCVGGGVLDAPQIRLSPTGQIVAAQIAALSQAYEELQIEKYVIMPNHVHMLLKVSVHNGTSRTPSPTNAVVPRTVSTFKRLIHKACGVQIFQRGYYDHIIRCEEASRRIWEYIDTNPQKWQADRYYY